ncbi:MAG: transglutaminase domain-containing protein [Bacteroidia bacterium]|nr:transglutaminase domain-containing protein [Bacteroidia bacterium]
MKSLHIVFIIITLYLVTIPVQGQISKKPTSGDISKARKFKVLYPDFTVVANAAKNSYQFDFDPNTNKVIAYEAKSQTLIALEPGALYQPYQFFDEMSVVESAGAIYKNNKVVPLNLKREKFNSDQFFYTDAKVAYFNLDFPDLGFQYSTEFKKRHHDIKFLSTAYLHSDLPCQSKTIEVVIPEWLNIEIKEMNFKGYCISKNIKFDHSKKQKTITYKINNIVARSKESNSPGPSYIYPHLLFLPKSYTISNKEINLFSSLQDLYNWYWSLIEDLEENPKIYSGLVQELIAQKNTELSKLKSIYNWVQDNIRYIAFEDGLAGFQPALSQDVFNNKYGDCKGMSNLLKQMLKLAGFDARLAWIGTRDIAYDYSTPSLSSDNHMICAVYIEDDLMFLDATEQFASLGEYAERIQDRQVLIENGSSYLLRSVPKRKIESNSEDTQIELEINETYLEGRITHTFSGECKSSILYHINNTPYDSHRNLILSHINANDKNIYIQDLEHSNAKNKEGDFSINIDAKISNQISTFESEKYFNLELFGNELSLIDSNRESDLFIPFKSKKTKLIKLKIPEGYDLKHLPNDLQINSEFIQINTSYRLIERYIICHQKIIHPKAHIPLNAFNQYNKYVNQYNTHSLESILIEQIK